MNKQRGFTAIEMISVILWLAAIGGWIANIVKIIHTVDLPTNGMFIVRCVGVFMAPLGAVLGYF